MRNLHLIFCSMGKKLFTSFMGLRRVRAVQRLLVFVLISPSIGMAAQTWTGRRLGDVPNFPRERVVANPRPLTGSNPTYSGLGSSGEGLGYTCGANDRACELLMYNYTGLNPTIRNHYQQLASRIQNVDYDVNNLGGDIARVTVAFELAANNIGGKDETVRLEGYFNNRNQANLVQVGSSRPEVTYSGAFVCLDLIVQNNNPQLMNCEQGLVSVVEKDGPVDERKSWILVREAAVISTDYSFLSKPAEITRGGKDSNPTYERLREAVGRNRDNGGWGQHDTRSLRRIDFYSYQVLGGASEFLMTYGFQDPSPGVGQHLFRFRGPLLNLEGLPADRAVFLSREPRFLQVGVPERDIPSRSLYLADQIVFSQLVDNTGKGNLLVLWNVPRRGRGDVFDVLQLRIIVTPRDIQHGLLEQYVRDEMN